MATIVESALPSNVGTGTVIGTFKAIQKSVVSGAPITVPESGTVTFTPAPAVLRDATTGTPMTMLPTAVSVPLDVNGALSVVLVSTDDTDLIPSGWTWGVSFAFTNGQSLAGFNIAVPQGTTVDLTLAAPVSTSSGVLVGNVTGSLPSPVNATDGQVLAVFGGVPVWVTLTGGTVVNPANGGGGSGDLTISDNGDGTWNVTGNFVDNGDGTVSLTTSNTVTDNGDESLSLAV